MQYVKFGKQGLKVSKFGMGCMRFSRVKMEDGLEIIDEDYAIRLIRHAIDCGVNYFDTAYCYEGSEVLLGKALKDGYREKAVIATKMPVWEANCHDDYWKLFNIQLERLQTDYIDTYLFHGLNRGNYDRMKKHNGTKFLDEAFEKGKIRQKGFSIHGDTEMFKEVVDSYDWDMCLIQLNYLDKYYQVGIDGLKYAASKGLSVAIMEPLKGGLLSENIPEDVRRLFDGFPVQRSPAEWAFRWLYDMPEVSIILSGVNKTEHLDENIRIFNAAAANVMTESEQDLILKAGDIYNNKVKVGCTGCRYCTPCPEGVGIPDIFKFYNDISLFGNVDLSKQHYTLVAIEDRKDASLCVECQKCSALCPQGIDIVSALKEAHKALTK